MRCKIKMQFDPEIAKDIGVEEAIMYSNVEFWCEHNKANNTNFYDGRYWMYNTIDAFVQLFPFWTVKQIRRILNNLENKKYIKTGNYNTVKFDQTIWYSIDIPDLSVPTNATAQIGTLQLPKWANGTAQMDNAIPDNKPYVNLMIGEDKLHRIDLKLESTKIDKKTKPNGSKSDKNKILGTQADEVLTYFFDEYLQIFKIKPTITNFGRFNKATQKYLKLYNLEKMKEFVDAYFSLTEKYYKDNGYSVNIFLTDNVITRLNSNYSKKLTSEEENRLMQIDNDRQFRRYIRTNPTSETARRYLEEHNGLLPNID